MLGFELRNSGVGSKRSVSYATTPARKMEAHASTRLAAKQQQHRNQPTSSKKYIEDKNSWRQCDREAVKSDKNTILAAFTRTKNEDPSVKYFQKHSWIELGVALIFRFNL